MLPILFLQASAPFVRSSPAQPASTRAPTLLREEPLCRRTTELRREGGEVFLDLKG